MKPLIFGKTGLLRVFYFFSIFLFTSQISAQGPCDSIKFSFENYQPCCYRLHVDNSLLECYNQLRLTINIGSFTSFNANASAGWSGSKISPTELLLTHSSGRVPKGISLPVTFCLEPGQDPLLSVLWDNICAQIGCFADFPLKSCSIKSDACIIGVKYKECNNAAYSNQATIPGVEIKLFDGRGVLLKSTVTDSSGEYSFCDLPPGNYLVKETNPTGWTAKVPASGQYNISLSQSEIAVRNFGNCPSCSCDSIYVNIVEDGSQSDSCFFTLAIYNTGGDCFQNMKLSTSVKSSKSNHDNRILEPGWTFSQIDSQTITLFPPGGTIPIGVSYPLKFYVDSGEVTIKTTSYFNNGGKQQECTKDFSFVCPKLNSPSCCPSGTTQGAELVKNGDFEKAGTGPIDFSTCYTWFNPGSLGSPGKYSVLQSNQVFAANTKWSCLDHTQNSITGKMLVVDGQKSNCNFTWQEQVTVQPGIQYSFCAFVNNLVIPGKNLIKPIVELRVNNTLVKNITLPQVPDQWESISGLWQSGTNTTALLEIRIVSISGDGNDFAVDDISFRSCIKDSCTCGPYDFMYGIGRGPLLPYHCNDTLSVPSSGAIVPIRFFSSFSCIGPNCPQTTVDWILTGPAPFIPISMNNVIANPTFSVPITNATFAYPGLYTLTVTGYCNGKPCPPCILYFKADGHDCCNNQTDFELGITNAVHITLSLNNNQCKAILNIGNLPKCDSIGPIFWGDGTAILGNLAAGTMPMHTYTSGAGTYYISWTATEYDYSVMPPRKCFEKVFRDSVNIICDTCQCKSFSPVKFLSPNWSIYNVVTSCGGSSVQLPCIKPGQFFIFGSTLHCNAANCIGDSVHWNIVETNSGQLISFGTSALNQSGSSQTFYNFLNPALFNPGVQYMLNLTGQCGSNICLCKVNFSIEACPCPCDSIKQDVSQGFYVSGNKFNCNRIIKPVALCSNDKVSWVVTPTITPSPGNSIGNNSQLFQFSNPGNYNVCMFVSRVDPVTHDTCRESYCRKVKVNCSPNPSLGLCDPNVIKNGDFTEELYKGVLNNRAEGIVHTAMKYWNLFPNTGDGLVQAADSSGSSDDGQVILIGNKNNFAGIWQQVNLTSDNYINIGFDYINYRRNNFLDHLLAADIVVRLQNDSTLNASSSTEIVRKAMKEKRDDRENGYQRFDTSLNFQFNPELKYLVICLQNQNDSVLSVIGLDNIEMCSSKTPLGVFSENKRKFRIYPNPSTNYFTIEMEQEFSSRATIQISDLTGRRIIEKQLIPGRFSQIIDVSNLYSGLYLIQTISDGKVMNINKLIKL